MRRIKLGFLELVFWLLVIGLFQASEASYQKRSFSFRVQSRDVDSPEPGARRKLLRNATLPLHGAVKDFGYFYASLYLGTPPKKFAVIVDTGSTMTYVPCSSCGSGCGPNHQDAAFDPQHSASVNIITCDSPKCKCGSPNCACSSSQQCMYTRSYAEQSSSSGILLEDLMSLHDGGDGANIIFGCETQETGEIFKQRADGLFGLGNSDASVMNQLVTANVIDNVFSLCFGSVEGDGALTLGHSPLIDAVGLQYTPLVPSMRHPYYYNVNLESIWVGEEELQVRSGLYSEGYGTVLDSGTTFTYMPTPAFIAFADAVEAHAESNGLLRVPGPDPQYDDVCFGNAPDHRDTEALTRVFPTMKLTFDGGVELDLSPLNYLFVHTFGTGKYCLGVFDNGSSGTLLGGITFRNVLVQYDRGNGRIGFGTAECKSLGETFRPPCSALAREDPAVVARAAASGDCTPDGSTASHIAIDDDREEAAIITQEDGNGQQDAYQQQQQQEEDDDQEPQYVANNNNNDEQDTLGSDEQQESSTDDADSQQQQQQQEEETPSTSDDDLLPMTLGDSDDIITTESSIINQQQQQSVDASSSTSSNSRNVSPLAYGLLGAVVFIMAVAFGAALMRPKSRESVKNMFPRLQRYRPINDEHDPESGGGGVLVASNTLSSPKLMVQKSGGSFTKSGGGGSIQQVSPLAAITNSAGGLKDSRNSSDDDEVERSASSTISVIAMTELSAKLGTSTSGGEKRAGLTTPQKLQRTTSNPASAAAMAAELAAEIGLGGGGGGGSTTPKAGGVGSISNNPLSLPNTPPSRAFRL